MPAGEDRGRGESCMRAIFEVGAIADPQALCRILGYFSQAWLTPSSVVSEVDGDQLNCRCVVDAIDRTIATRIARKLEASTLVLSATVRFAPCG